MIAVSIQPIIAAFVQSAVKIETPAAYADQVELFDITYECDGNLVKGFAAAPLTFAAPLDTVIYNRGGNREFATLRPEIICKYAGRGFFAVGSQYRGNAGGTGREQFGGDDIHDVIRLIDLSLALPFTRKDGVFMSGHSRGGMMTYLCCKMDTRIIAAAVGAGAADNVRGFYDREDSMKQVYLDLIGGTPEEMPAEYARRSAVCWAHEIKAPILIGHGDDDWRVDLQDSLRMHELLTAAGLPHKFILYPGADHSLMNTSYFEDVIAWFQSFVAKRSEQRQGGV